MRLTIFPIVLAGLLCAPAFPQEKLDPTPVFRVTAVARSTKAVNYRHRSGSTHVDFEGGSLMPKSKGEAKVESKQGRIEIDASFEGMSAATQFGPEYLTYVLWAITPEGRPENLGEVVLNGGAKSKLSVTTELQAFGLIVTAEPYYAVTQPSDLIVLENIVRPDTLGRIEVVDAKYELLKRGSYTLDVKPGDIPPRVMDQKVPLELYQARNAVQLAVYARADKYVPDTFKKANDLLNQAEVYQSRKKAYDKKPVIMMARQVVQTAEDARIVSLQRQDEERLAKERADAAAREAKAKAETAAAEAQRRAEEQRRTIAESERQRAEAAQARAEADRLRAQAEQAVAERAKLEAELAAQRSARERAEAESARAAALAQQQAAQAETEKVRQQAAEYDRLRQQAEKDRADLRLRLQQQLNMILQTRDSARGLIVNMSDVLFDTAKFNLRPIAREKLARVSGIVLAHPGLRLEVEGHTDSVGSEEYNQTLSEKRASAVRDYLVEQGLPADSVSAKGYGKTQPVADNATAAGRQQNRRVELVVSGESVIGGAVVGPTNIQQ